MSKRRGGSASRRTGGKLRRTGLKTKGRINRRSQPAGRKVRSSLETARARSRSRAKAQAKARAKRQAERQAEARAQKQKRQANQFRRIQNARRRQQVENRRNRRIAGVGAAAAAGAVIGSRAGRVPQPRRRTVNQNPRNTGSISPELQLQMDNVQQQYAQLEAEAQLSGVYEDMGRIDSQLTELALELDELESRGFVHGASIDDRIEAFDKQWDELQPKLEQELQRQVALLDEGLDDVESKVNAMQSRPNSGSIQAANTAADGFDRRVDAAERAVSGLYNDIKNSIGRLSYELRQIDWMLDHLETATDISLYEAEGPLAAVEAEWQQDGEEGPDGVLFLTDQRMMFEQREEVTTKKLFGIIKTESETVQGLLWDVDTEDIESIEHGKEGGFLGMGKDEIIEFVFSADAPISRAKFKLEGQSAEDWVKLINRVISGEIDEDRADDYVEELEEAEAVNAAFPGQCPNCYGPLEAPPRGVASIQCPFCEATITPEVPEDD